LILAAAVIYLILPLLSTVAFSLATVWSKSILPEGYTLDWYRQSLIRQRRNTCSIGGDGGTAG
jgi:putative spermidine/putrescine transport system permease protein